MCSNTLSHSVGFCTALSKLAMQPSLLGFDFGLLQNLVSKLMELYVG